WRVILSDLDDYSKGIRKFFPEKHYILSSEFKHLYVAITRARERLWIFEEDAKLSESICTYWIHKKLVKVTNEIDISTLTKTSSPSEWNYEGKKFFEQRKYVQALFCFKKSGNEKSLKLARAYHLQQVARTSFLTGSNENTVKSNFVTAAQAFEECSRLPQAASCYESIGMYKKAGDIYSVSKMFEPAARCYLEVKMWNVAGEYFEKAKKYNHAAFAYKDGNLNDMITDLIQRQDINDETIRQINIHFRNEAEKLISHNKFEEAADMLNRSVDDDENTIEASKCLFRLCRDNVLKELFTGFTSSNTRQELCRLQSKAAKTISKVKNHSIQWNRLTDQSQLYISFLNEKLEIYDMVTDLTQRHRQDFNDKTIRQLNFHFRKEADKLISHNKFEEAADMLIRSVDNDDNIINASRYLFRLCRIIVLKEIFTGYISSIALQDLFRLQTKAADAISKVISKSKQWMILMEESRLYSSYLNNDLDIYGLVADLIQRHRQDIDDKTVRQLDLLFRKEAEKLISHNEFEEAADMLNRSVDNYENAIDASQYLVRLCRVNVLKALIIGYTSSSSLRELCRLQTKAAKAISKVIIQSKLSKFLMEETHLYDSYLNEDLDQVHECGQYFMNHEEFISEFFAVFMWLQIPSPPDMNIKYWNERLQCLLRLCKLVFPYITPQNNDDISKISKEFEDIFLCFENKIKNSRGLNLFTYNPLYFLMDIKHKNKENEESITDCGKFYDFDVVHQKISQFLIRYICELISKVDQVGRGNPDVVYSQDSSSPFLLQRLKLARLQYTVVRQLDVLCHYGHLSEESKEFLASQNWWAENLVKCHMCYQSPHISCPEVTYIALTKPPIHIRDAHINAAYKTWLFNESKNASDFEILLKCMYVIQQLQDKTVIDEFNREMSKTKLLSHPNDLAVGFEYYCGNYQAIPVGRSLSQFFLFLYTNKVIPAIISSRTFINYAIKNIEQINLTSSDALGDLTSLMEFTTSLIFAVGQVHCDICLPRSFLTDYLDAFTAKPLIPDRYTYSRKNYLFAINNSIDQVRNLLDLLFSKQKIYLTIILRLIRLLVLIGLNESNFVQEILYLFKQTFSKNKIYSTKIQKYLEETNFVRLVEILYRDLREERYDSLIIVHHNNISISKFACFEKFGVKSFTYNSIEDFRSSLRKISSSTRIPGQFES
ncbi:10410_t:CDS:2, partial [Funneliformis mosseae]